MRTNRSIPRSAVTVQINGAFRLNRGGGVAVRETCLDSPCASALEHHRVELNVGDGAVVGTEAKPERGGRVRASISWQGVPGNSVGMSVQDANAQYERVQKHGGKEIVRHDSGLASVRRTGSSRWKISQGTGGHFRKRSRTWIRRSGVERLGSCEDLCLS